MAGFFLLVGLAAFGAGIWGLIKGRIGPAQGRGKAALLLIGGVVVFFVSVGFMAEADSRQSAASKPLAPAVTQPVASGPTKTKEAQKSTADEKFAETPKASSGTKPPTDQVPDKKMIIQKHFEENWKGTTWYGLLVEFTLSDRTVTGKTSLTANGSALAPAQMLCIGLIQSAARGLGGGEVTSIIQAEEGTPVHQCNGTFSAGGNFERPIAHLPLLVITKKGMGVSRSTLMKTLDGITFEKSSPVSGEERWMGSDLTGLVMAEVMGPADDVAQVTLIMGIAKDAPQTAVNALKFTAFLFRDLTPGWSDALKWFNSSLDAINRGGKTEATTIANGRFVKLSVVKEMGMIFLTVSAPK